MRFLALWMAGLGRVETSGVSSTVEGAAEQRSSAKVKIMTLHRDTIEFKQQVS